MSDTKTVVWDYDYQATTNTNNDIVYYENERAIQNAFIQYLNTDSNEVINQPNAGNPLMIYKFQPINPQISGELYFILKTEILNNFTPNITLNNLFITPDYNNKKWDIQINYTIPLFSNIQKTINFEIKRVQLNNNVSEIQIVTLTGEKLYKFCITYLYDMYGISIKWNGTYFQWGDKYLFTQLTVNDPYYDAIIELTRSNKQT